MHICTTFRHTQTLALQLPDLLDLFLPPCDRRTDCRRSSLAFRLGEERILILASSDGTITFNRVSDIPSEPFGVMIGFKGHLRDVFIHSITSNISQTLLDSFNTS